MADSSVRSERQDRGPEFVRRRSILEVLMNEDDEEDAFWDLPDLLDDDDITLPMPKLKLTSEQNRDFNYSEFGLQSCVRIRSRC